jgi:hypothetical protein
MTRSLRRCANCATTETCQWFRNKQGEFDCNACALRFKKYGDYTKRKQSNKVKKKPFWKLHSLLNFVIHLSHYFDFFANFSRQHDIWEDGALIARRQKLAGGIESNKENRLQCLRTTFQKKRRL